MKNATPLFNKLCQFQTLWNAWTEIKRNKSIGGIDNIRIIDFDEVAQQEIEALLIELESGNYIPLPYKNISIPKGKNKQRVLGLLSIRDKIVQHAMNKMLYPIIDKVLLPSCYAYRKGKGAVKAVKRVLHSTKNKHCVYIVSCDIKTYFDTISHKLLFGRLQKLISDKNFFHLIELCSRMGKVKKGNIWLDSTKGIPQGSILSPALANLFLLPLDTEMQKLDVEYIRYADDFIVLCREKDMALLAVEHICRICQQLQLELKNPPVIDKISNGFTYLGITFFSDYITLSKEKKQSMLEKIQKAFQNTNDTVPLHLTKQMNGFKAFYGQLLPANELLFIDEKLVELMEHLSIKQHITKLNTLQTVFANVPFLTFEYEKKRKIIFAAIIEKIKQKTQYSPKKNEQLIKKRKREYQKLESQGKELIVNSFGAFIGVRSGKISVSHKDRKKQEISLTNLNHITILSKGVSFSSDCIYQCSVNNVPISFFTHKGEHYATLYKPNNTDSNLWLKQLLAIQNGKAAFVSSLFIEAKIRNQANLLKYFHKYHKTSDADFAKLFKERIDEFSKSIKKCKQSAKEKDYQAQLLAVESSAAMLYWKLVEELINDDSDFKGRERKGAKDLVNCMLNYGYAILYARIWEAILYAKLNPYISYLHVQNPAKPTLVFDFIEMFRQQAVDRVVISLLQKKEKMKVVDGLLCDESRAKLAQHIYERLHRYEKYRGESRRLSDIIKIQARVLAEYLNEEQKTYKPYIAKW